MAANVDCTCHGRETNFVPKHTKREVPIVDISTHIPCIPHHTCACINIIPCIEQCFKILNSRSYPCTLTVYYNPHFTNEKVRELYDLPEAREGFDVRGKFGNKEILTHDCGQSRPVSQITITAMLIFVVCLQDITRILSRQSGEDRGDVLRFKLTEFLMRTPRAYSQFKVMQR